VPVPLAEVRRRLVEQGLRLEPDATRGWGPASHMRAFGEGAPPEGGLLGFIGAMTENFCEGCNRVRVAADGSLRACLGGRSQVSLKGLLRDGTGDEGIAAAIVEALAQKAERHEMGAEGSRLLPMLGTGG
jgi:cyclic pyranopterin phosphate synthase